MKIYFPTTDEGNSRCIYWPHSKVLFVDSNSNAFICSKSAEGLYGRMPRGQKFHCEIQGFRCNKLGHVSSESQGNAQREMSAPVFSLPEQVKTKKLPAIKVFVDGQECTALVDSGCSQTLANKAMCRYWRQKEVRVLTADGRTLKCKGMAKSG